MLGRMISFWIGCLLCWTVLGADEEKPPELFLQTGHSSMIVSVAYSPDGRYVATCGGDRSVRLWDAERGIELRRFFGHQQMILSVAFSPDGGRLITGSLDKTARIWDAATGKQLRRLDCETLMVSAVAFSPDGMQALTVCYSNPPDYKKGSVKLWDAATGKLLKTFAGHDGFISSAAFSPDGQYVLTGSYDGTARLWDIASEKIARNFTGHTAPVRSVAFSSDGKMAATGADDKTARQWDVATGKELKRFTAPGLLTQSVLVFPDARRAGTSAMDGSAYLYDIASGKEVCHVQGPGGPISCGTASPDDRRIVTGSLSGEACIWDAATGKPLHRLVSQCSEVAAAVYSSDGKYLVTGGKDGVARLWDAATGRELRQFIGHTSPITAVSFSRDGQRIVTASGGYQSKDHTARLWDVATGRERQCFRGHTDSVNAAALSPDGQLLATGGTDKTVRLWDTATGKELRQLEGHTQNVTAVAFSADGARVLTGSWDTTARLWDAATGKEIMTFETAMSKRTNSPRPPAGEEQEGKAGEDNASASNLLLGMVHLIQSVAFAPDGRHVLTGGCDWTARLFDIQTGNEVRRFEADFDPNDLLVNGITSVAFAPDGKRILTGTGDRMLRVWDTASGMEMRCLKQHTGAVNAVAFSPDGKRMLSASDDGTTRLWDAATGRELVRLVGLRQGGEWVAVTPEGYFDGSLEGRRIVMWRVDDKLFPLESYEKKFHRPDLVAQAIEGQPIGNVPSVPTDRTPPTVSLQIDDTTPDSATVRITATAGSPSANIVGIRVMVDGRDLSPKRGRGIVRKRVADNQVNFLATVDFPPGKQDAMIAAVVTDDFGLQNDPIRQLVERPVPAAPVASRLFVLAVGVSRYQTPQYHLSFCHADAESLAAILQRQKGLAFDDVQTQVLTDENATATAVAAGLHWLRQSCSAADVAVVLFSGHGYLDDDGLYYLTYEAEPGRLKQTSLPWKTIADSLRTIEARQVLFLSDCCHAGAFGSQRPTQDQLAESLVKEAGVMVFASSRGSETSVERDRWGHGAFVRAVLDGLDGRADLIADGQINISELQTYVVDRVGKLTNNTQHPFIPRLERFDPGLVLARISPPSK